MIRLRSTRHLTSAYRDDGRHRASIPWNVAADLDVDMSFTEQDTEGMLEEDEADHHAGMDVRAIARQLSEHTSGHPYPVSRICQLVDERVPTTHAEPCRMDAARGE